MVHGNSLCYECHHDHLCGEITRRDCQTIKIDDLQKLIKVGLYFLLYSLNRTKTLAKLNGISVFYYNFLFQLQTKTDSIQAVFKNAIAEVERNTNAILDLLMNKADL